MQNEKFFAPPSDERVMPPETEGDNRNFIEHLARYDFARGFLKKGMNILDAACGSGYGSHLLAKYGCNVIGGDISQEAVSYANKRFTHENLTYTKVNCIRPEYPDGHFDAYVSFETIEHFFEQDEYLTNARRILKAGGLFICSTPNKDVHEFYRHKGWMGANPYHLKELTVQEFRDLLEKHFPKVELYAQDYDPLALKMLEMNRIVSELRWEMDHLPITLIKKILPQGVLGMLGKPAPDLAKKLNTRYNLDMAKISKLNIENADTLIAVCYT
ncbi:hypothetical protein SCT_0262 [Sulfuricella sp. T08]|uniref:class I SAM-dependent methyltransferase n=1 Tax=Sulfuricella sp. T08 TaxID=1632857 RepID=UPI0006179599|nr:class I SAM-dependent methyltransferase [Sulfuricella sp. T08]GAO34882.1 hypothetical protein SCT_0262 [Sulfuricella sp. T08]